MTSAAKRTQPQGRRPTRPRGQARTKDKQDEGETAKDRQRRQGPEGRWQEPRPIEKAARSRLSRRQLATRSSTTVAGQGRSRSIEGQARRDDARGRVRPACLSDARWPRPSDLPGHRDDLRRDRGGGAGGAAAPGGGRAARPLQRRRLAGRPARAVRRRGPRDRLAGPRPADPADDRRGPAAGRASRSPTSGRSPWRPARAWSAPWSSA